MSIIGGGGSDVRSWLSCPEPTGASEGVALSAISLLVEIFAIIGGGAKKELVDTVATFVDELGRVEEASLIGLL